MPAAQRNFPYNRKPSDFNQADWLARHTTLLNEHRDRWIQSGYDVRVESQNAFQLRGHSAILAGKPDLLVLNKNRILITDSKTGQEQPWHKFQVMTYMYALPMALPEYRDFKFAGEIVYNDRTERVPQGGIDQGFVRNLGSLIRRIAAPEPQSAFTIAASATMFDHPANRTKSYVDRTSMPLASPMTRSPPCAQTRCSSATAILSTSNPRM